MNLLQAFASGQLPKVLAIASAGGHWKQLMIIDRAFEECETIYATTVRDPVELKGSPRCYVLPDANYDEKFRMLWLVWELFKLFLKERPDYVVTTGAAPGALAVLTGRLFGARTMFIDSIANAEKLSFAGRLASKASHITLVQWKELADERHTHYWGSVL